MNLLFNPQVLLDFFNEHRILFSVFIFSTSFIITFLIIPKIIFVTFKRRLLTEVGSRSSHKVSTPVFGGVAFFITIILILSVTQSMYQEYLIGNQIIAAVTILFIVGLKDDLVVSTAKAKLVSQIIAVTFVVFLPELNILSLKGFLGIYEIGFLNIFAMLFMLMVINGYNLIDGIDGLAAIIGIIICGAFAYVYFTIHDNFYFLLSVTVIGSLAAFLRYNLSNTKKKLFMGDTGSLIIGFIIGLLSLRFLTHRDIVTSTIGLLTENSVPIIVAILCVLIFDTSRIVISRILEKKHPFEADRNHAHHILLDSGLSHLNSSLLLGAFNIVMIIVFWSLGVYFSSFILAALLILCFIAYFFVLNKLKKRY
ncbi:UDP-N-acetylmuramyl pentapeptide phosphotransferase/UDP-N-acetylglucosamine-1-phosphate transferase [Flavobacteriaceae bacterium MAR_2010_188]|nr:UDP-N-acetylmuramyl pentapeptide phosphotransferase/UDP-N-acetylglucosamine-1-phosphate transferase [Flavobacteriaceae bacterium MAR_2010_188]